jgi:hypothetical protein
MSLCSLVNARCHITKGTVIVGHLGQVGPNLWVRGKKHMLTVFHGWR